MKILSFGLITAAILVLATAMGARSGSAPSGAREGVLRARVVATGIPGAGAVSEVGDFLRGSPLHDNATLAAYTQPGRVLEARRVLVASTSNFGAPLARPNEPEGAVLSIDPAADQVRVPAGFAAAGGQASALDGAVQIYTAQSAPFVNGVTEPQALTADQAAASLPLGISLNNGNGRPWIANAPNGANGDGTVTVLDPQGYTLAGAPSAVAGGVFAGNFTNRNAASTHGLTSAALGTAIITKAPDLTGRAVFAAIEADGSVVQIHVQKGVDGLAPPGTVTPLTAIDRSAAESTDPRVLSRIGMVFNWAPTRNLFIADPQANRIVVLNLYDDGAMFSSVPREILAREFDRPIDLAPTAREISAGSFASNTTLGGGSDIYVLNRGNNSIVRMSIEGDIRATRAVEADLPGFRLNGIAVSSDGQTIYLTATVPNGGGALLAAPAFGATAITEQFFSLAQKAGKTADMTQFATFLFSLKVTPDQGLGPLFNAQSCAECHNSPFPGGMALLPGHDVRRVGRLREDGVFDTLQGRGGPVARMHSVAEMGSPCDLDAGIPAQAEVTSRRNAMTLRGAGLIDTIALGDLLVNMAAQPAAVRGRPNVLADGRVGKFGWKADSPTLIEFMGEAFRNELGLTNTLRPRDEIRACGANQNSPEVDGLALQAAAKFLNTLDPPAPAAACTSSAGARLFESTGCTGCHTPALAGPGARQMLPLYSDLLLHDMGPALDDHVRQGSALGSEWRTTPLWKLSERSKFLHDGRASTVSEAIAAHMGQAQTARDRFLALDAAGKQALLDFLGCI